MSFMFRNRRLLSVFALVTFAFAGSVMPAAAYYHPGLGRFLSRDPDGTAIVVTQGLPYHARNPVVTVTASGEVQYADGLNLYQFVRSNPIINADPSGLFAFSLLDQLNSASLNAYVRGSLFAQAHPTAMQLAGGLMAAINLYAFAKYEEVQAIVVSQPNPAGFLAGEAAAVRGALREVLRAGTSIAALGRISPAARRAASTAAAVVQGEYAVATGQEHHGISTRIWRALEEHRVLRGIYRPRDARFVTRAANDAVHRGYQQWHRDVDDEVIRWLDQFPDASQTQFEQYLRSIYNRPEMRERFPHGLD